MATANALNQDIYNAPGVTRHYANLAYLSACEKFLFQNYIKPGMAVLDIGVGGGRTTPYLSSLACKYVGIDYAAEMIQVCRKKFPALRFEVLDAGDLNGFADASFDAIVMAFNVIDYVLPSTRRRYCVQECHRLLKAGGVLIFSSHNPRSIFVRTSFNSQRVASLADRISPGEFFRGYVAGVLSIAASVYAILRSVARSVVKTYRKISTQAFWKGHGVWLDPSHGGLVTHTWTPKHCIADVCSAGFQITKYLGDDFPRSGGQFMTDWYYYVFNKI